MSDTETWTDVPMDEETWTDVAMDGAPSKPAPGPVKVPSDAELYVREGADMIRSATRPIEAFNEAATGMLPGTDLLKTTGEYIGSPKEQGWSASSQRNEENQAQLAQDYPNITKGGQGTGLVMSMALPSASTVAGRFGVNNALGFGEKLLTDQEILNKEGAIQFGASLVEPVMKGFSAPSFQSMKRGAAIQTLDPNASQAFKLDSRGAVDNVADALAEEARFGQSRAALADRLEARTQQAGQTIGSLRDRADELGAQVDLRPAARKSDTMAAFSEGGDKADRGMQADWATDYAKNEPVRSVNQVSEINTKLGEKGAWDKVVPSQEARAARGLRAEYVDATEGAMSKVLTPDEMDVYGNAKKEFGLYKTGDEILDKTVARNSKQGFAGIKDILVTGVNANSLEGGIKNAFMAAAMKQVRQRAGSSATAVLRGMENIARKFPNETPAVKNWISQLSNAAARNPEAVNATYYILQKQDPEFRQAVQDEDNKLP